MNTAKEQHPAARLACGRRNVWDLLSAVEKKPNHGFAEEYKQFLDAGKTEAGSYNNIRKPAKEGRFLESPECTSLKPGTRFTQ